MHFMFATRGISHGRDIWKEHMNSQYFDWLRYNLNICACGQGKAVHPTETCKEFKPRPESVKVQGSLRPIELWEYVFPKESLQDVLASMEVQDTWYPKEFEKLAWAMRKGLKLSKIPKVDHSAKQHIIPRLGFGIHPIGIKEDPVKEVPEWGYKQEML